jgi:hypothetical protein
VILKNNNETITTNGVKLTALPVITIIGQPTNQTTDNGTATFRVSAITTNPLSSKSILTYQWQYSTNNKLYNNLPNQTNTALLLTNLTRSQNNYYYRVIIKVGNIQLISNSTQLKILPTILSSDILNRVSYTNTNNIDYANVEMSVTVGSTAGNITYQWQQSKDAGSTYSNLTNTNVSQITVKNIPKNYYQYYKYRVLISNPVETITVY